MLLYAFRVCRDVPWHKEPAAASRAELADSLSFFRRRKMFGTLTLIKRNGSEGSTMTMDSRETTIGR